MTNEIAPSIKVAKGATYLFLQGLVSNLIGLIFLTYVTRTLSADEIGVISASQILLGIFFTFGTFAIPSSATKYISESLGKNDESATKGVYKTVLRFGFLDSFLLAVLLIASSNVISTFFLANEDYQVLVVILGLDIFGLLFSSFLNATLLGMQRIRIMGLVGIAVSIVKYGTAVILLNVGFGLTGIVTGWTLGDLLGLIMLFFFASNSLKSVTEKKVYPFKELVKYSGPLYFSGILSYFATAVDRLVLLSFLGLAPLGIYRVALASTLIVGLVGGSISSSLFPQLSKMYGEYGAESSLKEVSVRASRYIFLIYMPVAVGLAAVSLPAITLFFGPLYASGWLPLTIVSLTMALTSAGIVINNLLMSFGATRIFPEANALAILVGILFSVLLVAPFGMVGAAFAKAALTVVLFIYPAFRLWKLAGLHIDSDSLKNSLIASAVMAGAVGLVEFLWMRGYLLPLYVMVGVITYAAMLKFLNATNSQDIKLMKEFLPKSFGKLVDALAKFLS